MKRIVGIDPGLFGGFCVMTLFEDYTIETVFHPMPLISSVTKTKSKKSGKTKTKTLNSIDYYELCKIFGSLLDCTAFLEKVHGVPLWGAAQSFQFGETFGALRALLHSHKIEHYEVMPKAWQDEMHAGIAKDHEVKQKSLIAARRLFPNANLVRPGENFADSGFVDALLIAEYGRKKLLGSGGKTNLPA